MGPSAANARDCPARRAAPTGSAVASAWVARLSAAKARPHNNRRPNRAMNPLRVAYPNAHPAATSTASEQVSRSPWRA